MDIQKITFYKMKFDEHDVNGDGHLDYAEFNAWARDMLNEPPNTSKTVTAPKSNTTHSTFHFLPQQDFQRLCYQLGSAPDIGLSWPQVKKYFAIDEQVCHTHITQQWSDVHAILCVVVVCLHCGTLLCVCVYDVCMMFVCVSAVCMMRVFV